MEVTTDDMEIVTTLRGTLAEKVGKQRFDLWFGNTTRIDWDGHSLMVSAPDHFYLDWIRSNFRHHIESACLAALGQCPTIKFRIDGASPADAPKAVLGRSSHGSTGIATIDPPALLIEPPTDRSPLAVLRKPHVTVPTAGPSTPPGSRRRFASLGSFVSGPSNRLAAVSAEMVARTPGHITPLFLHGPTGVGKTHLLEGIWTATRKSGGGPPSVYLSAEQFTSQFLEALRGSGLPSFRNKYRAVGILILDDLQFFAGKRATQVELLHTMDTLLREGRQMVFAADRPPADLAELGPELVTRLASGMVCRVDPPEYQTRLGVVSYLAKRMGVSLPADVERFVASRLTAHARELSGAICRLQATSQAHQAPITLALAEEALSEMIHQHSRVLRLGDIQNAVCKVFGIEPTSLQSDGKSKRLSQPRMLAMWLARKHTRAALSEICAFFGRRSHSTVISAQKRVDQWMTAGDSLRLAEKTWDIDEAIRQVERHLLAG